MNKLSVPLFAALSIAALAFAANASAAEGKTATPQQQKFADCAHQSKGMKGDTHKKFMSDCLKGSGATATMKTEAAKAKTADGKAEDPASAATTEPRDRMETCNAEAKGKGLKGKDRRSFMSQCLKD